MMTTVEIPLSQGKSALIDAADLPLIGAIQAWHTRHHRGNWYAVRNVRKPDGRRTVQRLHTFLTGWPFVDHINGNGLDNRRCNLRPATAAQNAANKRKEASSSRFKGVSWYARTARWHAQIAVTGRRLWLGSHLDEVEAALAYDAAARTHFGEFAALNFPDPSERSALLDPVRIGDTSWTS